MPSVGQDLLNHQIEPIERACCLSRTRKPLAGECLRSVQPFLETDGRGNHAQDKKAAHPENVFMDVD